MASIDLETIAPLRRAPERAAVLVDFDGTLAPIVERADAAVPLPGVGEALAALAQTYAVVGVISGRPAEYLVQHVPDGVELRGLYGLEQARDGVIERHPAAVAWGPVIDDVAEAAARSEDSALEVEHKGLSLTVHYRTHPGDAGAVLAWATAEAARTGLELREAKMSVELHPPVRIDKGTAVEELAAGLDAVCFVGDDVGDLPAFDALDRLAAGGVATVRVAVTTSESVRAMVERADVLVDGPEGALDFLRALLP
jgi:trehalose 6-phosphate phosphatase